MTRFSDLWKALTADFTGKQVKQRNQAGRTFSYLTARTVMNRLDTVLGPENWWDDYIPGENSVICRLTVRLPDGSTLTKADAGGYAGMADQGDDDKSGFSDAFKRAAVKFGVGRSLYQDGVPTYIQAPGCEPTNAWKTVPMPPAPPTTPEKWAPTTARELLDWVKDQIESYEILPLKKRFNTWVRSQGFPERAGTWSPAQILSAWHEAERIAAELIRARKAELSVA